MRCAMFAKALPALLEVRKTSTVQPPTGRLHCYDVRMSTASRAFLVIPISLALLFFAAVAYAQEDTDANEACPSAPDVYVYVSGVAYLEKINGKVNLYGRKCVDYESGD